MDIFDSINLTSIVRRNWIWRRRHRFRWRLSAWPGRARRNSSWHSEARPLIPSRSTARAGQSWCHLILTSVRHRHQHQSMAWVACACCSQRAERAWYAGPRPRPDDLWQWRPCTRRAPLAHRACAPYTNAAPARLFCRFCELLQACLPDRLPERPGPQ